VAGRVDRRQFPLRLDAHPDFPRHGVVECLAARQHVVDALAIGLAHLLVSQPDFLRSVRLDRENTGTDQVKVDEFQQGRIARASHNLVVDATRLVLGQELSAGLGAGALKIKPSHCRSVRHRQDHFGLQSPAGRVAQRDVQGGRRHLLDDRHVSLDVFDGHGFAGTRPHGRDHPPLRNDDIGREGPGGKVLRDANVGDLCEACGVQRQRQHARQASGKRLNTHDSAPGTKERGSSEYIKRAGAEFVCKRCVTTPAACRWRCMFPKRLGYAKPSRRARIPDYSQRLNPVGADRVWRT